MKQYRIRPGASFRLDDGTVATAGDVIELADDVAAMHAGHVDLAEPAAELPGEALATHPAD